MAQSEHNYLDNYLLRDQIREMKDYSHKLWKERKAKMWSDGLDERDYQNAREEYTNEVTQEVGK